MLPIEIPKGEFWDEKKEEFVFTKGYKLRLEHSLVSISKWEAKWHVSFFEKKLNPEQFLSYVKCMTIEPDIPDAAYERLTERDLNRILDYIHDPMTATKISETETKVGRDAFVTSELVYYWMTKFNIPAEFERWHINRLITLIRVCIAKEQKPKKLTPAELYARHAAINARNQALMKSKGKP